MNKLHLKKLLLNTPETNAKVSPQLHQDVMRAVRLTEPLTRKPLLDWRIPAWGAAMAVTVITVAYLAQTTTVTPIQTTEMVQSEKPVTSTSLTALGDKLTTLSQHTLVPEQELREELERLKSDLERFDFRS